MTVQQLPEEFSLTSTISDIILTNVGSINFSITFEGEVILSEIYDPDVSGSIRIRDLGKIMERYLYGTINPGRKEFNYGRFNFLVDGVQIGSSLVLLCYAYTALPGSSFHELQYPLHLIYGSKVTIPTVKEFISFCMHTQDSLSAKVLYIQDNQIKESASVVLTTAGVASVHTFEVSLAAIAAHFPEIVPTSIVGYELGVGDIKTLYKVDWSSYVDTKVFRYLNVFSCPMTLITRGQISRKRVQTFETSKIEGKEQRYAIKRGDLFNVSIGRKFSRTDEALFAEMMISKQVQVFYRGAYRDVVITEEDSDEVQRRGTFSESSFSFRFSDESLNTMLFDPTWILENGTWNDWGEWLDEGLWND